MLCLRTIFFVLSFVFCAQAQVHDFDTYACELCVAQGCTYCAFADSADEGACQDESVDESGQCTERTDCDNLMWGSDSLNSEFDCLFETEELEDAAVGAIIFLILICCCCCGIPACIIVCCVQKNRRKRPNGAPTLQATVASGGGTTPLAATSSAYNGNSNPPPPLVIDSASTTNTSNVPFANAVVVVEPEPVPESSIPSPPAVNPNYQSERGEVSAVTPSDAMLKDLQRSY